jgi:hypothetical protein
LNAEERIQDNITGFNENGVPWGSYLSHGDDRRARRRKPRYTGTRTQAKSPLSLCVMSSIRRLFTKRSADSMNPTPEGHRGIREVTTRAGRRTDCYYGGQRSYRAFDIASDAKTGANWDFLGWRRMA